MAASSLARYVRTVVREAREGRISTSDALGLLEQAAGVRANPDEFEASRAGVAKAVLRYRLTHWGLKGNERLSRIAFPDPSYEPLTLLGRLKEVGYITSKAGDPSETLYRHDFEKPYPMLAFGSGGLFISSGDYSITARGIVG